LVYMKQELVGRKRELEVIDGHLNSAVDGKGSTILITGEPGIGKTSLIDKVVNTAEERGFVLHRGIAIQEVSQPFNILTHAFSEIISEPLFDEQEFISFAEVFAINQGGLLMAQSSTEEGGLDADIFAGMLTAVQNFVKDSFDASNAMGANLGRLEYGNMKILIENGQHLFLTAVLVGREHPDMANILKSTVRDLENEYEHILSSWSGDISEMEPVSDILNELANRRFIVRKDLSGLNLESEIGRISETALEALATVSAATPILLVLEDMQWASETSLKVIEYIVRNLGELNVLLLGSARPGEQGSWDDHKSRLVDDELVAELPLKGFDRIALLDLIKTRYSPNDFPDDLYDQLLKRTEGNPFFALELVRHMEERNAIVLEYGEFIFREGEMTLPDTVEDLISSRLDDLDSEALSVAEFASCMGREFDLEILAEVSLGRDIMKGLEALSLAGILKLTKDSGIFSHGLFQEFIYDNLSPRWRTNFHKGLGDFYERTYVGRADEVMYELARHYLCTNLHEKGFDYSIKAAEKAEASFAIDHAMQMYNSALSVLPKLGKSHSFQDSSIHERIGDLHSLTGSMDEGLVEYRLAVAESSDEIKAGLYRKSATFLSRKGDIDLAFESLDKAISLASKDSLEFWRIEGERASTLINKGELDNAIELSKNVLDHLNNFEDTLRDIADINQTLGIAYYKKGNMEASSKQDEIVLKLREDMEDLRGMAQVYGNIGISYIMSGDFDSAKEQFLNSIEIEKKIKDSYGLARTYSNLGGIHYYRSEWDDVLKITEKSLEIKRRIGDRPGIATSLDIMGLVNNEKGEIKEALKFFEKGLIIKKKIGDKRQLAESYNFRGNAHLALGEIDKAEKDHQLSLELRKEMGDTIGIAASLNNIGDTLLEKGNMNDAEAHYKKSMDLSSDGTSNELLIDSLFGFSAVLIGSARYSEAHESLQRAEDIIKESNLSSKLPIWHRQMGLLLAMEGMIDQARENFNIALKELEEVNALFELAITQGVWGEILGANDDQGRVILLSAKTTFEKIGNTLWSERCEKALE